MTEYTRRYHETLNPCVNICPPEEKIYPHRKQNINLNMNYTFYNEKRPVIKTIKTYEPASLINNHNKSIVSFCNKDGKICKPWHNQSDRAYPSNEQPHIINHDLKYIGGDIKHNHYDRYLRRLKAGVLTKK